MAAAGQRGYSQGGQRAAQLQGAPCWQPQAQADGAATGVWQPQVQAAPMQGLQLQALDSVFMGFILMVGAGRNWPTGQSLGTLRRGVLNVWADPRIGHGEYHY